MAAVTLLATLEERLAPPAFQPPPTEHWLAEGAEARNKTLRKAWFAERKKTPDGSSWRTYERRNGLAQIAKRNAAPPPIAESPWVERGSDNQAGRMHVATLSADGSELYAGSSKGGVWVGSLDGDDWTPIGDNLYGGAHWLVVTSQAVVAATDSGLVHRSTDLGVTWEEPSGLPPGAETLRLLMASDGSETVFLVLEADGGGVNLLRSTDHGASFEIVYDMGDYEGDMWSPRTGEATLYLLVDDAIQRSSDAGDSWELVGELPVSSDGGELVGSEAGAPRLWAANDGRLRRSDDAGATWETVTSLDDYWGSLNASTVDPDLFLYGGVETYRTIDGGDSWGQINQWEDYYDDPANRLHADVPGIDVLPDGAGGETWYIATDGGLYRSSDSLLTVENLGLRGLRVSQYYGTLTSSANPDHVAAGAQDQGYQVTNTMAQDSEVWAFEQTISGDYAHLTSGDGTHDLVYSVYPGFVLVQVGEDDPWHVYLNFPQGLSTWSWLPPVVADPDDPEAFFFCGNRLWRYERTGVSSWSSSLWSDENFNSGGGEYLSGLVFSPIDVNRAYAVTSQGSLYTSDDKGVTWTESASIGPDAQYFYGSALAASHDDVDVAWVGGNGYSNPPIRRTTDGGLTWETWDDALPPTMVYGLEATDDGTGRVVAGTELAAYLRGPDDEAWVDITGADAPVTTYWSVELLPSENTFRFGTYGRGIWDYRLDVADAEPEPQDTGDTAAGDTQSEEPDEEPEQGPEDTDVAGPDPGATPEDETQLSYEDVSLKGSCGCGNPGGGGLAVLVLLGLVRRRRINPSTAA